MNFIYNDSIDSRQYIFGEDLNNYDLKESLSTLSVVSYRYIDFDKTSYHFFKIVLIIRILLNTFLL